MALANMAAKGEMLVNDDLSTLVSNIHITLYINIFFHHIII